MHWAIGIWSDLARRAAPAFGRPNSPARHTHSRHTFISVEKLAQARIKERAKGTFHPGSLARFAAVFFVLGMSAGLVSGGPIAASVTSFRTNTALPNAGVRPPRRLEEEELRSLLVSALNRHASTEGTEWEIRFTRPWIPIQVPDGPPLRLEVIEPAFSRIASTCIFRFELSAGDELLGSWQMPSQVRRWEEVLVASTMLMRGAPLAGAALVHERRDVMMLRNPLSELPADVVGFQLSETVPAGAPLTARAVQLKPVVFRGQTADAVVQDGAMMISLKVEVLQEGVPGQIVRVRNVQSRREFRGKVQDERTILVML